ncbi:hypothetical protein [Paenibacillus sp. 1P03SA]|uniref:hypothetical protein n=1 Tax=Paenibacillus sp. 1P03SA TaxID=3132294 RepID=UPI0039A18CF2
MSEKTMIEEINKLKGVTTTPLNMFNLHTLYVDGVEVGYVRKVDDWIEVLAFFKYSYKPCDNGRVSLNTLSNMIERFRASKSFYVS